MSDIRTLPWHLADTRDALDSELARFVAERLNEALVARGTASLAVSGGRTPAGFLRTLGAMTLDWSRIQVTLADERWVPAEHADSNARLVRETLLAGPAASAHFIPLVSDADNAAAGQPEIEQRLSTLPWPLDVVVLGMGDDGHTASLFPQAPELEAAMTTPARCAAITPVTAPHSRLSLSLSALTSARILLVHITGESKRQLLDAALAQSTTPHLPIRRVLDAAAEAHVFWTP